MRPLIFDTMGTTVSLSATSVPDALERVFADADARFSLYRADSEASRLARGEVRLVDASAQFREVYDLANDWRLITGGAFTAHRPDGIIDLSGVVKAWAMARAESLLASADVEAWCLNVGGDVATRGDGWTLGIVDPTDRAQLLTALTVSPERPAVATSGSAERGDHIWRTGRRGFIQVTVGAPDIVMADVLATAIVAAGPEALDDFTRNWPIDVLAVLDDGTLRATPGMRSAIDDFRAAA